MARVSARRRPERERVLTPVRHDCPGCGGHMRLRYDNHRNLVTLSGPVRVLFRSRRCEAPDCPRFHVPYRPEAECALALPRHEFGLDVITLVGVLRHRDHRSIPEIHAALRGRGVEIAERSVTNLLDRYDEFLATSLTDTRRLRKMLKAQGGVILALDGLQPDVGHEVLWVVRDCLSGEVLLARSLLSGRGVDLEPLLREVAEAVGVPVPGVVSGGQASVRRAVERALPGVPHQLCRFHFLREAAHPVFEADRRAKVALKAEVRGVRPIERSLEGRAIAAKGLTGPSYDGHTFWDTETFILQPLTYAVPHAAGDALRWRHSTLDLARERAKILGLEGASFPWRTIRGQAISKYWPASTAAFHINADISAAVVRYLAATGDDTFEHEAGVELLVETARLWLSLGHYDAHGQIGRAHV